MKSSLARIGGGLTCLVALAACSDAVIPTGVTETGQPPLAAGPPPSSGSPNGALVVRFENVSFFVTEDLDDGLVAFHWESDIFFCGGSNGLDPIDVMQVRAPNEREQFIVVVKGQKEDPPHVQVYEGSIDDVNAVGLCTFLATGTKVAEGEVGYNQVFTNVAFTANWRGLLAAADGSTVNYRENLKVLAEPHDPNNFFTLVGDIRLQSRGGGR